MRAIRKALVRLGIAGLLVGIVVGVFLASYFASAFPEWTGFAGDPLPPGTSATPVVIYDQPRDLYDWLGLLLVPGVLAVGGYWLTRTENRYALELQERREQEAQRLEDQRIEEGRRVEEQRIEEARKIEAERAQDAALQAYLDQMTELLLHENLRASKPEDEVRSVARARTLTVLKQLDGERKARVVQFLYEAQLIGFKRLDNSKVDTVLRLEEADLSEVKLEGAILRRADFTLADLTRADLGWADLTGADLTLAQLSEANLEGAELVGVNFSGAYLAGANLEEANLNGADFNGADLCGANLIEADLTFAHLEDTNIAGTHLEGADLEEVLGLDRIVREPVGAQETSLFRNVLEEDDLDEDTLLEALLEEPLPTLTWRNSGRRRIMRTK